MGLLGGDCTRPSGISVLTTFTNNRLVHLADERAWSTSPWQLHCDLGHASCLGLPLTCGQPDFCFEGGTPDDPQKVRDLPGLGQQGGCPLTLHSGSWRHDWLGSVNWWSIAECTWESSSGLIHLCGEETSPVISNGSGSSLFSTGTRVE